MLDYSQGKQSPSLQRLQDAQKRMLDSLSSYCELNDIMYFLVAGSALGAVRHNDMIPWDDDIDVGMLRDDYEKMLRLMEEQPIRGCFLQNWNTDPESLVSHSKLRMNGSHFVEPYSNGLNMHRGIFIDIFPFDKVYESPFRHRIQYWLLVLLYFINSSATQTICDASKNGAVRWLRRTIFFTKKFLGNKFFRSLEISVMKMANSEPGRQIGCFSLLGVDKFERTIVSLDDVVPPSFVLFSHRKQPVPKNYDAVLTRMYGKYNQFPPTAMQKPAHGNNVIFPDGQSPTGKSK